jgi:hypothetical protein
MKRTPFKVGNRVKVIKMPPQVRRAKDGSPEMFAAFQKALGTAFSIRGFDQYGHAELWLHDNGREAKRDVAHSIWVEPQYLRLV